MTTANTFRQRVRSTGEKVRFLSPQEVKEIINRGNVMIIDVGEAWQIQERGTIPGARNITRGELDLKADTELPCRDPKLQDREQKIIRHSAQWNPLRTAGPRQPRNPRA